jgi:replicative DNA helicase
MRKILRSVTWLDVAEKPIATENFRSLRPDRLLNLRRTEQNVLEWVVDFYSQHQEAPQLNVVMDHFEAASANEEVTLVEEISKEQHYQGASFKSLFEAEVEEQAAQNLANGLKEAIKIATTGVTTKQGPIKGTDAAIAHVFSSARTKPTDSDAKMPASLRASAIHLTALYQHRKSNPTQTYGILTGYGFYDGITAGIRKKQFRLLAGFGGHLKSTLMLNEIVNAACNGWNPLVFTSEMPAEELKFMLVAIHSANPKFNGVGRPLSAYRLLLGALQPAEEAFYQMVQDDLVNNPDHGHIRVIDTSEFSTFGSIMQRTVREHSEEEVDELWVDYITRLPVDAKYARLSIVEARNETLAEAKRFAMSFDNGIGLAVQSPFQINREGYKQGQANEGKLSKTALAQYNAAEKEADIITYVWYDKDEAATSEPKLGVLKNRYGQLSFETSPVFIEPDSRRMFDLSAGMGPSTGYAPTGGGAYSQDEEVEL